MKKVILCNNTGFDVPPGVDPAKFHEGHSQRLESAFRFDDVENVMSEVSATTLKELQDNNVCGQEVLS